MTSYFLNFEQRDGYADDIDGYTLNRDTDLWSILGAYSDEKVQIITKDEVAD